MHVRTKCDDRQEQHTNPSLSSSPPPHLDHHVVRGDVPGQPILPHLVRQPQGAFRLPARHAGVHGRAVAHGVGGDVLWLFFLGVFGVFGGE